MRAVSLLAAALGVTASGPSVSEHEGGEHPDVSLNGFQLGSVFFHQQTQGAALRRHILKRRASAQALPDYTPGVVDKELVQTLAKLNFIAYPGDAAHRTAYYNRFFPAATVDSLFDGTNTILGSTTRTQWLTTQAALWNTIATEAAVAGVSNVTNIYNPNRTTVTSGGAYDQLGVAALEFKRGGQSLLVFRGTYTDRDVMNQRNHIMDWVTNQQYQKMHNIFENDGGYSWTKTHEERQANYSTRKKYYCAAQASGGLFNTPLRAFGLMGVELALATKSTSMTGALKYGYWDIVKTITATVVAGTNATHHPTNLVLSGHGQGGGHAALASMWLRKTMSTSIQAVTFAANTGDACAAMHLSLSLENLKDDVDPFMFHPQLIDYTHALDPLGNAQGIYPGTRRFLQQRGDTNDLGYKQCEPLYGQWPLQFIYDNTPGFVRCVAATHSIDVIYNYVFNTAAVHEDGSTWGGADAHRNDLVSENQCDYKHDDYGDCEEDEHRYWIIGAVLGSVFGALTVIIGGIWCACPLTLERCCSKRKDIEFIMEEEEEEKKREMEAMKQEEKEDADEA